MRSILLLIIICMVGCEGNSFDSDKRQLIAKDQIRKKLRKASGFDVISFKQDTLQDPSDTNFKQVVRYDLDFVFKDSTGQLQKKKGEVLFTPDGKTILTSQIKDGD